jgi:hypothetical protein
MYLLYVSFRPIQIGPHFTKMSLGHWYAHGVVFFRCVYTGGRSALRQQQRVCMPDSQQQQQQQQQAQTDSVAPHYTTAYRACTHSTNSMQCIHDELVGTLTAVFMRPHSNTLPTAASSACVRSC